MIQEAAAHTIPSVGLIFWSFRGMVVIVLFLAGLIYSVKGSVDKKSCYLTAAMIGMPLPWIANELGWVVTEVGRQPWSIYGMLPVDLSVSSLTAGSVFGSLAGFIVLYSCLIVVEVWLMNKFAGLGPSSLGTCRYFFENHR